MKHTLEEENTFTSSHHKWQKSTEVEMLTRKNVGSEEELRRWGRVMAVRKKSYCWWGRTWNFNYACEEECMSHTADEEEAISSPAWLFYLKLMLQQVYRRARLSRRAFVENRLSNARIFVILPVYLRFWTFRALLSRLANGWTTLWKRTKSQKGDKITTTWVSPVFSPV